MSKMGTLTRTGYVINGSDVSKIPRQAVIVLGGLKKELTVRPIVNADFGFPQPPSKFSDQLRMEYAFQDSTELIKLDRRSKTNDPNPRR